MREIKFRLRCHSVIVGYEKWYNGHQIESDPCSASPCWLYSKDNKHWFPDYIYHNHKDLFTGLLDKNEKEIYEGDIVKILWYDGDGDKSLEESSIHKIIWGGGYPAFDLEPYTDCDCNGLQHAITEFFVEVIGNIYENLELLTRR